MGLLQMTVQTQSADIYVIILYYLLACTPITIASHVQQIISQIEDMKSLPNHKKSNQCPHFSISSSLNASSSIQTPSDSYDRQLIYFIFVMGTAGIVGICQICLHPRGNSNSNNQNGYAYESFSKIPFLGPINEYLRRIRPGPSVPQSNQQQQTSIIGAILPNLVPSGQPQPPPPSTPFSISSLVKQLPSDIMKSQLDILNIDSSSYTRKIKKSNYDQLIAEYRGTDKLYSDPDFLPNQQSLGNLDAKLLSTLEWKRLKDIIPNPIFVNDKIEPADILQGSLGDCYLLSALASLAEQEYRIRNVFPDLTVNPNGIYMARILHNGILQEVLIDDYFPVRNGKVGFAQPSAKNEIWVMILEKCWAKLYGSYANIIGGLPHEVLHAFSSAPVFYRPIGSTKQKQEALWAEMLTNFRAGALLCCGTNGDGKIEDLGFVKGHAYTILGVYDDPQRMIKLRNPWGHKEWKGRASDYDEAFWGSLTPAQKQNLDYIDSNRKTNTDGVFFILWEDFVAYFQLVDLCKINDNANYNFAETSFQHLTPTLFQFEVGKGQGKNTVTLALTQENHRGKGSQIEDRGYSRSFLALGRLNHTTGKYQYVQSNSAKTFPDNYMELQNLESGKYMLYAKYLWNNGNASNRATLSTYSASPVVISESPSTIPPLQFLQEIFYDHASRNPKKKNLSSPGDWICNQMLLSNGAFGYLVINIDPKSSVKLSVQLNEADFTQKKMEWEPPFRGKGQILEEVTSAKPLIVLFSINNETLPSSLTLPPPKIKPLS